MGARTTKGVRLNRPYPHTREERDAFQSDEAPGKITPTRTRRMTRTDPRTENKTARELMRENVQHALRDFLATYGEKESEIMSAFDTALEAIAVEVEPNT